jgi:hypothetical protein
MLFHDGYVQGVARRHLWTSHEDVLRAICSGGIHGEHLIDNSKQSVKCGLDGGATINRDIAVQDFLEHLCVRNEAFAIAYEFFEQSLRVGFMWMGGAYQVHGDVRVNENHECVPVPYPLSISANMVSMSLVGWAYRAAARITSIFLPVVLEGSRRRANSSA